MENAVGEVGEHGDLFLDGNSVVEIVDEDGLDELRLDKGWKRKPVGFEEFLVMEKLRIEELIGLGGEGEPFVDDFFDGVGGEVVGEAGVNEESLHGISEGLERRVWEDI